MMNLIYRGTSYQRQQIATSTELSSKAVKYRGCAYQVSASAEQQAFKPKLTYRGCPVA